MEAGAGKVACRGARVNIGDIDEMVSTKHFCLIFWGFFVVRKELQSPSVCYVLV